MRRFPFLRSLIFGAALLASTPAFALSCEEILNMVRVQVPSNIVVQTMENSGTRFTPADVQCLTNGGAPEDVVAVARNMAEAGGGSETPTDDGGDDTPIDTLPPVDEEEEEMLGGDFSDMGELSGGGEDTLNEERGPAKLEALIDKYRAKSYLTASKGFHELLETNAYPDQNAKIEFYMGKTLFEMGMYHSAQHYFMQVVRRGPRSNNPYFEFALPRLVHIARYTGNDYELLRIVGKIPPEKFPRQAKNHLFYLRGRQLYEDDELSASARYFQQISTKSDLYLRSKYFEGVIHQRRDKLRSAVKAFRDVYQAPPVVLTDARQAQEYEDLKDLSLINIARIYFGLERFDNADNYYALVDRGSTYWPESLFERGWTNFYRNDLNLTLGLLLTVQSPYYSSQEFVPEAEVLRSLAFFNLCVYDDVEKTLVRFESKYTPMLDELEGFLTKYKGDGVKLADQAFDNYFAEDHRKSTLKKSMFTRVLRNQDLSAFVRHLDMMSAEEEAIRGQKAVWRDSVGDGLLKQIEKDRVRYKKRAGRVLLQELLEQHENLDNLLAQSEIIRFEVADAQRADYEYKMQAAYVESDDSKKIDFATSRDVIYWPFNGEFWKDELGYYRYTEVDSCRRR